ncbi:MAG: hypothetical protein CR997_10165 [Acidobacteria bacterium]|nr:MAG: hypothetical protein CR997_10165 [Acidobacteriota bacterium]
MTNKAGSQQIFIHMNGKQYGPVSTRDLETWIQEKRVSPESLCWFEGQTDWLPVSQIFPQFFVTQPPPMSPPPLQPQVPVAPGLPSITPVHPAPLNKGKKRGLLVVLFIAIGVLVVLGGYFAYRFFADQAGHPSAAQIVAVTLSCETPVQFLEGQNMDLSSVGQWEMKFNMERSQTDRETESPAFQQDGTSIQCRKTYVDDFSGADIQETVTIELNSDWTQVVKLQWNKTESTHAYQIDARITASKLNRTGEALEFQCSGTTCSDHAVLTETQNWTQQADFNQKVETVFWGDEAFLKLTLKTQSK